MSNNLRDLCLSLIDGERQGDFVKFASRRFLIMNQLRKQNFRTYIQIAIHLRVQPALKSSDLVNNIRKGARNRLRQSLSEGLHPYGDHGLTEDVLWLGVNLLDSIHLNQLIAKLDE